MSFNARPLLIHMGALFAVSDGRNMTGPFRRSWKQWAGLPLVDRETEASNRRMTDWSHFNTFSR